MYRLKIPGAARKDIKKLPHKVQEKLAEHFEDLITNPLKGKPLRGVLKGYWKYTFSFEGVEYRITYQIFPKESLIALIMVGSRENFYERLKRRTRGK